MNDKYKIHVLSNGVKLYLYPSDKLKRFYVKYVINYGSDGKWFNFKYKNKKYTVEPGVAHFLEHLLGEHSKNGNIYTNFSKKNYGRNGVTTYNKTFYYFEGIRNIKKSIKELIEAVDIPVFTKEDVEHSRKAILEECKIDKNDYFYTMCGLLDRNIYNSYEKIHKSLSVIGNPETTNKIDYDMLKLCYDAFYYDENKYLLIAGNFDENKMIKFVESIYENIPKHEKKVKEISYDLLPVRKRKEVIKMNITNPYVGLTFKEELPLNYDKTLIQAYLMIYLYAKFSFSNKFINKLLDKKIIEKKISDECSRNENILLFTFKAYTKHKDKYIKELIKELKKNDITKKKFDLFKKAIISDIAFGRDNLYNDFKEFQDIIDYDYLVDELIFIKNLNYKDFIKFTRVLKFDNYIEVVIEPNN